MITSEIRDFLTKTLLFCLVLAGISLLLFTTILRDHYLNIFPVQFAVVALVTLLSHLRLMKTVRMNVMRFSTTYLATMSIKLFLYIIFILVCLLIDRSRAIDFVISFLILYIFFTIFEVIEISNFLKKNTNSLN